MLFVHVSSPLFFCFFIVLLVYALFGFSDFYFFFCFAHALFCFSGFCFLSLSVVLLPHKKNIFSYFSRSLVCT